MGPDAGLAAVPGVDRSAAEHDREAAKAGRNLERVPPGGATVVHDDPPLADLVGHLAAERAQAHDRPLGHRDGQNPARLRLGEGDRERARAGHFDPASGLLVRRRATPGRSHRGAGPRDLEPILDPPVERRPGHGRGGDTGGEERRGRRDRGPAEAVGPGRDRGRAEPRHRVIELDQEGSDLAVQPLQLACRSEAGRARGQMGANARGCARRELAVNQREQGGFTRVHRASP